jgi:hypothetical protein
LADDWGFVKGYNFAFPRFHIDFYFVPFKRDFEVGGDPGAMDAPFFSALVANLKSINFTNKELHSTVEILDEKFLM